jgi:uncharacterized membrane protein
MKQYILIYLASALGFFALDMVWLGLIAKNFYREKLSFIFTGEVDWKAAALFYSLYFTGLFYFGILPGLKDGNWTTVLLNSALFGFFCYATYDFTNKATILQWPWIVVGVDLIWGVVVTSFGGLVGFWVSKLLK